ncbi:MAG: AAC(3) family N-acetyltransferase [Chloroflexota bacterium]|nr:AAC(3) family N-acetyltransferase [Chloroflexota bacterium]MDE2968541.1 AAC(3) family N-acetyltransferase [Chloroflexota bacterium]
MRRQPVGIANVTEQLRALGVQPGQTLQVHTAFSTVGPIEGGPIGLIEALRAAIGPGGTLVMPSMSDDDDHPFDPQMTPCLGMGVTADAFWRLLGVLRSDSPHAFAAVGPNAERITAPHPIVPPHGIDSPVGRVWELGGHVLLLGVGHDADTTVHLAENLAGVRYRRDKYVTVLQGGVQMRFEYAEIDHCCERFALVDTWLDERNLQRRCTVGHAEARLVPARNVVEVVVERLRADETAFLHPAGTDTECDEAWASLRS